MNMMQNALKVRPPGVAGLFYSRQKNTLEREVAIFLETATQIEIVNKVYGLIAPHAGYMYSGGVAARSYRQVVDREYDVVVVIAPSHHVYFEEISVFNGDAYRTPLGDVEVHKKWANELPQKHPNIIYSDIGHEKDEHSLEVQLPFLQHVLGDFRLIPIVMGNQDHTNIHVLSEALTDLLTDKKALIVASSDLSHYYSSDKAAVLDSVVVEHVNNFDEDRLEKDLQLGLCEMCGGGPVITMMKTCRNLGANKSKVLIYRNSGDVTGERGQVVGYLSAMIYK
ncbi:MAG TPA: AmmeMemoRadiSam system protein B [Calditrichaeota bacterium]|nr:AmmeMemoRadiSam system protein B [Calditrichota bacterium]